MPPMIRAVVFDVDECLVDETRIYGGWADWLGVPRHTFAAQLGAVVARGGEPHETFEVFRPGFDLAEERARREAAGEPEWFGEHDLYPDVRLALRELRAAGLWLGVAGNQSEHAGKILRALFTPYVELIAVSESMGLAKPDLRFFEKVLGALPAAPEEVLYVGDRVDQDIRPAASCGMPTALIRRGPFGFIRQHDPEAEQLPTLRIRSLRELAPYLAKVNANAGG